MFDRRGARAPKQWGRVALVAAVIVAVLYIIIAAWAILVPFVLGAILAWIVLPAVNWLERHLPPALHRNGVARLIGIFVVYAVVLAIIAGFLAYFVPTFVREVGQLVGRSQAIAVELQSRLSSLRQWYEANVPEAVRAFIQQQIPSTPNEWLALLQRNVLSVVANALRRSWAVIFGYVIVPFWLIYLIYDAKRLHQAALSLFPESNLPDVVNIGRILNDVAGAYLRGQIFVAASIGVLTGLAYYGLGVDFPIALGVLATVGDLIPTFGPILAGAAAVIIAVVQRPILALWVILVTIGIHQFENLFVGPRVVGTSVRLRPALIIILLLIAGYLWGILGLLLVVPITAVLRDIFRYLYLRTSPRDISPDEALRHVRLAWRRTSSQG